MSVASYRDLEVWQRSIDLTEKIYKLTAVFPKHELYGLTSQTRRAAVSIAANVAEGHGRESTREYLHHLSYSMGSLAELETHLTIAQRLGYAPATQSQQLFAECDVLGRMLRALQRSLRRKLSSSPNP